MTTRILTNDTDQLQNQNRLVQGLRHKVLSTSLVLAALGMGVFQVTEISAQASNAQAGAGSSDDQVQGKFPKRKFPKLYAAVYGPKAKKRVTYDQFLTDMQNKLKSDPGFLNATKGAPGANGLPGKDGAPGAPGKDGAQGPKGDSGITVLWESADDPIFSNANFPGHFTGGVTPLQKKTSLSNEDIRSKCPLIFLDLYFDDFYRNEAGTQLLPQEANMQLAFKGWVRRLDPFEGKGTVIRFAPYELFLSTPGSFGSTAGSYTNYFEALASALIMQLDPESMQFALTFHSSYCPNSAREACKTDAERLAFIKSFGENGEVSSVETQVKHLVVNSYEKVKKLKVTGLCMP